MNGGRLVARCVVVAAVFATLTAGADTTHSILGHITTNGKPLAGIRVDFGENLDATTTDDAGYYESEGAIEGSVYLIEPAASGWTFSPARRAVVMGSGDEQVNFVAEPLGGPLAGALFAPPTAGSAGVKDNPNNPHHVYVDAPTSSDTWTPGKSYNIRWHQEETDTDTVEIRLYKGGMVSNSITSGTANDGSFWWKLPSSTVPGTDYHVRVRDGFNMTYSGSFTVESVPVVTYPSEKCTVWRRGQAYQIKWQGFPGANVKIQLYRGSVLSRGIAWSTPNDKSYWWTVPADQRTADNYKVKVTARSNGVTDSSDKAFAIVNNPRVTYPTASGVVWDIGASYNITWRQFECANVKIDLIRCGSLDRTITSSTSNDGSFSWQVPYDLSPSGGPAFEVRVRAVGCAAQSDKSNNPFYIRRVPAVTQPTANGIVWNMGSAYNIKWHGFSSAYVKIELLKGWVVNRTITNWTANDGSFKWWGPAGQAAGSNYRIRVRGTGGSTQQDVSDRNFTIALAPLVKYPSASGISVGIGDTLHITWQGFQTTQVRIYLERWDSFNTMVAQGTPNDGSFNWTIPPGTTTGNGFKIKIRGLPGSVIDVSNHVFQITP